MASRKNLKKDIDYLITELVADCYACIYENPDMDFSGLEEIINNAVSLREDLTSRINQFDNKTMGKSRPYFNDIKKDLVDGLTDNYKKLEKLVE